MKNKILYNKEIKQKIQKIIMKQKSIKIKIYYYIKFEKNTLKILDEK